MHQMIKRLQSRLGYQRRRNCAPGPRRLSTETARGCDLETLRQMGGWSDDTMLMTYTHLAADDLKREHATGSPLDNL
jgi:hypothetical protein